MSRILVSGAGGFIGTHLAKRLKADGHWVRGADLKYPEFENSSPADEFLIADLRSPENAWNACNGVDAVFHLACEMGGIGHTLPHDYSLRLGNARIDQNTIEASMRNGVGKFFYASTACVYNEQLQGEGALPLREEDVYPAQPDLAYGWLKLAGEQLLLDAACESQMQPYIARFHNVYGELGTWEGGKEKAPAALCRKVALAKLRGDRHIEIWGDGQQARTFMYIDDCVDGILRLMEREYHHPLNLGRDELVTINALADLIMDIADYHCTLEHDLTKPQGVRSRNSDNTRLRQVLEWEPSISLQDGITRTYRWIEQQVLAKQGISEVTM